MSHTPALIAAAPDLLVECKKVIAWFEAMKRHQFEELVLGQTFESASRNWETLTNEPLDLTSMMAAIAKAEGRL